jgi:hypothetical protein
MVHLDSPIRRIGEAPAQNASEGSGVWPALVNVYQKQGYESGYARGVNDVLATILETTEDFARLRPEAAAETRRLLHAFSEYLDRRIRTQPRDEENHFVDGLGI